MNPADIMHLTARQLQHFMDRHRETTYMLVDVRQPFEYAHGHIPGAFFLPLSELESKLFELPEDRDLIFYCRSGGRSLAAASMAFEAEVSEKQVYNLEGGMLAWNGAVLSDFPRVQTFEAAATPAQQLEIAMNLERGAWRFYADLCRQFPNEPFAEAIEELSTAETAHARAIYHFYKRMVPDAIDFEAFYEQLPGDILEGGLPIEQAKDQLARMGDTLCIGVVELALQIEYAAFDLYRTMAENQRDEEARKAFFSIAQAEKAHMRILAKTLNRCGDPTAH